MTADEIIGECGQSIVLAIGPAVLDRRILALDIAGFAQAPTESGYAGGECYSRSAVEETNHWHRRLLRARRERPRGRRAAEQRYELAALHLSHAMVMARPVRFVCRIFRVSWSGRRILGADLKCSESGTWAAAASCRAQQAPGPKVALRRKLLFLDKRTLAFAQGLGRLFSRNAPENLVVIPFCLGFARRLNFDEIHVVRHAAVPAHSPFGEEIVDRQLPYLICDRPSIYRPRCLHRPEIVQHR